LRKKQYTNIAVSLNIMLVTTHTLLNIALGEKHLKVEIERNNLAFY
jgi:hypothetical protein